MRREQLEHVLRAASQIADDPNVLVIGSQSVLGAIHEERLPLAATASMEIDVAFFDDTDDRKADRVDGAIGELSQFHETFGYYAQGVSVSTAVLPDGWRDRLVVVDTASTAPGRGHLLEPHDCVVSKLVAGREKDYAFADALVHAQLIDLAVIAERIETVDVLPAVRQRLRNWVASQRS
ncbi:MAG: hypothetical protein JWO79_3318 [Actinomycetia bacterium]|jgi:hypothetical protein|nr:hypothetical protein [Actinomycetes bacterium]MDQ1654030.1 hypothetical protein [Cryptosporangiaceae bacterium]MDQ1658299.1 hypothetical protein [Cryptosporangiaceae bacterium]